MEFHSLCAHEMPEKRTTRPHVLPIYATSSFDFESIDQGIDIFNGTQQGNSYSRYSNPTVSAVGDKIALLETAGTNVEAVGIMVSSGMSAISSLAFAVLKNGDAILTQGNLYGGTTELFYKIFEPLGVEIIIADLTSSDAVEDTLKKHKNIKLLYCETPANPTLACLDIEMLCFLAHKHQVKFAIDNTFCSPYLQKPFSFGADFIIHSTTKYLCGHGTTISGCILSRDAAFMKDKIFPVVKLAGTNCSPFEAWLVNLGIKTLPLRMKQHCSNAQTLAEFLEQHPNVSRVNYPGLKNNSNHALAARQMQNGFGGMLSFELKGGFASAIAAMNKIKFCSLAPTLGDVDTLILHPASSSHLRVDKSVKEKFGITDGLIRVSTGIEDVSDIIADIKNAIN